MTVIEIKPHRWGWKVFEAPGVEPVFPEKRQAISYAQARACFRSGEIRVVDSKGNIKRTIAFNDAVRKLNALLSNHSLSAEAALSVRTRSITFGCTAARQRFRSRALQFLAEFNQPLARRFIAHNPRLNRSVHFNGGVTCRAPIISRKGEP